MGIRGWILAGLLLAAGPLQATTAVVAVDPGFAPVAGELGRMFHAATGYELALAVAPASELATAHADVLLADDAELPAQLAASGRADPASLMTYAMGATGTGAAAQPRDAVLLLRGSDNPAAQAFMAFLLTPEVWDVIVAHGFGAH